MEELSSVSILVPINAKDPIGAPIGSSNVKLPSPSVVNTCPTVPSVIPRSVSTNAIPGTFIKSL